MKQSLADVKREIKELYDRPELTKHLYHLHSILMHSGQADSGHYYAFIYDRTAKNWHRYSDTSVEEVAEDAVINDAVGGVG
jgi:ubiquitin carboxyl-terminal hydrolase 25/28